MTKFNIRWFSDASLSQPIIWAVTTLSLALAFFATPTRAQTPSSPNNDHVSQTVTQLADPCRAVLITDDTPQFYVSQIDIQASCKTFTVVLQHKGRLPKSATGHNWALVLAEHVNGVTRDGSKASTSNNFIKPGDERVIAHIPIVGRGEAAEVSFATDLLKVNEPYTFLSTVDGQSAIMRGTLVRLGS